MTHSTFLEQPLPTGCIATKGYLHTATHDTGFEGVTEAPAGGLSSTAADMATFGQMLLGHGTYNGVQILQPASVALLLTPQFTPGPGVSPWDLGFYDDDRNGVRFIGHGGDLIACHSQFWIEPAHGLSFFISYNSQGASQKARGELFNAFVDRYLPGPPNAHPAYVKLTSKQLAPYTGFFLSSRRQDSTIFRLSGLEPKEITATKEGNLTSLHRERLLRSSQSIFIRLEMIRSMTKSIRAPFTSSAMRAATSAATRRPATPTERRCSPPVHG